MAQEEKQLLLKDLCSRLPHGIFVYDEIDNKSIYTISYHPHIDNCKPYLRPMSSMTDEERKEINKYYNFSDFGNITIRYHMESWWDNDTECSLKDYLYLINWLNKHHFDYRGLIKKGLALEAPEGMYKNE